MGMLFSCARAYRAVYGLRQTCCHYCLDGIECVVFDKSASGQPAKFLYNIGYMVPSFSPAHNSGTEIYDLLDALDLVCVCSRTQTLTRSTALPISLAPEPDWTRSWS